jgi:hypothetical protein
MQIARREKHVNPINAEVFVGRESYATKVTPVSEDISALNQPAQKKADAYPFA